MQPPASAEPAIRAHNVVKTYGATRALDGFSLEVSAGSIHGLLGPNGAGKTTAVGILTTLTRIDGGAASVAGVDVRDGARLRRRIGLVGQNPALDEILGGRENLVMFGRLMGLPKSEAHTRADELFDKFGLTDAAGRAVSTYSGGMRRRLDIAVGLVLDPAVLFLDEPTTGLDPRGRLDVWDAITGTAERGTTVLLTTQYLEEADRLAGRVSIMQSGAVIAEGTPAELKRQRGGDRVEVTLPPSAPHEPIVTALGGEPIHTADGVWTVAAPRGAADLVDVVRGLDAAGIAPDDITLRRPTLDEVFLALTDQEAA